MNDLEEIKSYLAKKKQKKLNPNAQKLIEEIAIVNRIQNQIDHANTYSFRSFRLSLEMEKVAA